MRAKADPEELERRLRWLHGGSVVDAVYAFLRKRCGPSTHLERVRFAMWALSDDPEDRRRQHCGVDRAEVERAIGRRK